MQRWEYCVLQNAVANYGVVMIGLRTHHASLWRITSQGVQLVSDFKKRHKDIDEHEAIAQMIYQLGEEGWELVQDVNGGSMGSNALWFKRPKT